MWAQAREKNLVKWVVVSKGRMGSTEKPCDLTLMPRKGTLVRHKPLVRLFGNISRIGKQSAISLNLPLLVIYRLPHQISTVKENLSR